MAPPSKPTWSWNLENTLRLLLLLNNSIALALSFACMQVVFFVLGSIHCISLVFNLFVLLPKTRSKRLKLSRRDGHEKPCPSLIILATDVLAVLAFLSLYISSTISITGQPRPRGGWSWSWGPTLIMVYASIGGLTAFVMHAVIAVKNLHAYIRYRDSGRCTLCHQVIGVALPESDEEVATTPSHSRHSLSANSQGEHEDDMLVMKT
ncbi:hypothetical protein H2200_002225 [Cladophialophora chaetospira]|uniref:Uncharacterized protein n=1 Tax=Cladophialophora chaetospira TaxID=386627 RepID=A0AA38XIK7_9EURO|nr:hypothetical protein H2200_002225 [Cladophialophora chaetospira]